MKSSANPSLFAGRGRVCRCRVLFFSSLFHCGRGYCGSATGGCAGEAGVYAAGRNAGSSTDQRGREPTSWWERYEARVSATQSQQPHWLTPLVTVTPRLEQEVRDGFSALLQHQGVCDMELRQWKGAGVYSGEAHGDHHQCAAVSLIGHGASDGFGDISFLAKERIYSRNEEHGNGIVTFFLGARYRRGRTAMEAAARW